MSRRIKRNLLLCCLGTMALLVRSAIAREQAKTERSSSNSAGAARAKTAANSAATHDSASSATRDFARDERMARLEGEKRFRTNCGRCHQPPHKFSPRVMATAIRHMRVRAMITDEDMRLILKYMTQ
jgi:mono/diheme cytochrome c family protein